MSLRDRDVLHLSRDSESQRKVPGLWEVAASGESLLSTAKALYQNGRDQVLKGLLLRSCVTLYGSLRYQYVGVNQLPDRQRGLGQTPYALGQEVILSFAGMLMKERQTPWIVSCEHEISMFFDLLKSRDDSPPRCSSVHSPTGASKPRDPRPYI